MSRQSDLSWVIADLEAWGRFLGGPAVNLSYPSETIEHRMMTYGPDSMIRDCKKRVAADPTMPEAVQRAETVLLEMLGNNFDYEARTLEFVYTHQHLSSRSLARALDRPRTRLQSDIEAAHMLYAGIMLTIKKSHNRLDSGRPKTV